MYSHYGSALARERDKNRQLLQKIERLEKKNLSLLNARAELLEYADCRERENTFSTDLYKTLDGYYSRVNMENMRKNNAISELLEYARCLEKEYDQNSRPLLEMDPDDPYLFHKSWGVD